MDPLSPSNINAGWATSPTTSTRHSIPSPTPSPLPTASSSSSFRDPKVFGAPGLSLVNPPSENGTSRSGDIAGSSAAEKEKAGPYLRVRIGGLERNRKDLLIRFDASTNIGTFRTGMYRNMQRSYVEFQRFAEQAQAICPQTIIPALPLASTSAVTDEEDDRLVRIALQRWFTRICEDPVLLRDDELRAFIESDFGYSPNPPPSARRPPSASSATNVLTAALSKVVRRGPLDEDDELASAKTALEKLEGNWGGAAAAVGNLGKARRTHALAHQDVGSKFISLSTVESDPSLVAAERKAGRTLEQLSAMAGAQAASENVVLSDSLGYQALNARSAKDALLQRTQILEDSQTASKVAITKRRNVERLKGSSSINPGKVDDAISEMDEATALETQLSGRLHAISQNLHVALRNHSRQTHDDVALALLENARLTIGFHKHALRELEALRPDIAKIGTAGAGLSTPTASTNRYQAPVIPNVPPTMESRPYPSQSQPQPAIQAPAMEGSRSMFLPPSSQPVIARPNSAEPPRANVSHDPLAGPGGPVGPGAAQAHQSPQNGLAQSMMMPGQTHPAQQQHPGYGYPGRAQTLGRGGGRKLDERQAAKLLAGGF